MLLAGDELGNTPERQQQRLLPGQRDRLDQLGRGRRRPARVRQAADRAAPPAPGRSAARTSSAARRSAAPPSRTSSGSTRTAASRRDEDWDFPEARCLGFLLGGDAGELFYSTGGRQELDDGFVVLFNAFHEPVPFILPGEELGKLWEVVIDTANTDAKGQGHKAASTYPLEGRSLVVLIRRGAPILPTKGEGAAETMPAAQPPAATSAPLRRERGARRSGRRVVTGPLPSFGAAPPRRRTHPLPPLGAGRAGGPPRPAGPRPAPADAAARWRLARGRRRRPRPGEPYRFALESGQRGARPGLAPPGRDVHGPSLVVDPRRLRVAARRVARPALGTRRCSTSCTSAPSARRAPSPATRQRLPHLAELGVTAVELMPIAEFPGSRNWGYDGVLPFAPDPVLRQPRRPQGAGRRGARPRPDGLPRRGLQPLRARGQLPARSTLRSSSPTSSQTPWGAAINFRRARRCATSSSTTRSTGSRSTASTGCASTPCTRSTTPRATHILVELAATRARAPGRGAPSPPRARERGQPGPLPAPRRAARAGSTTRSGTTTPTTSSTSC